ncbi:hypothetical protein Tco_1152250 [Tanacetum coccineum]
MLQIGVYNERDDSFVKEVAILLLLRCKDRTGGNFDKTNPNGKPYLINQFSLGTCSGWWSQSQKTMGIQLLRLEHKDCLSLGDYKKLRVKKLEKKGGSRTHKLKRLYKVGRSARIVSSDEASLGDQEDASKQGRKINDIDKDAEITLVDETQGRYGDDIMFDVSDLAGEEVFVAEQGVPDSKKDDVAQVNTAATTVSTASTIPVSAASITDVEITLAQALAELKSAKPTTATSTRSRAKGLVIHEQEQAPTPTVSSQQPSQAKIQDKGKAKMIEPEPVKKLSKKDQLKLDEEVAQRLQAEFDEQERIEREKFKANIALKETWDDIQAKIEADQLLAKRLQAREQEELTIEERAILFQQLLEKRRKHFAAKKAEEKRNRPPTKA